MIWKASFAAFGPAYGAVILVSQYCDFAKARVFFFVSDKRIGGFDIEKTQKNGIEVEAVIGDGAYSEKENLDYCEGNGIKNVSKLSKVPGGIGTITTSVLMENVLKLYKKQRS